MTTHASEPEGQTTRPRDPRAMDWCENTGPFLPLKHRAVLKLLGEFADPDNGCAWPAQETMARILGTSRQTINKICNELEALEVFEASEQDTKSGKWTSNVYHLAGFESGWVVTVPQGEKPYILMTAVERQFADLKALYQAALQRGVDHGLDMSDLILSDDTDNLSERVKFENGHGEEEPEFEPVVVHIEPVERVDLGETSLNDVAERLKEVPPAPPTWVRVSEAKWEPWQIEKMAEMDARRAEREGR